MKALEEWPVAGRVICQGDGDLAPSQIPLSLYVLHQQECTGNAGKTTHMYKGVRVHSTGCTQLKKYKHTPAKSEGSTQYTKCKEIILLTVSVSCKG